MLPSSPFDWGVKSKKSKVPEGMIWSGAAGKVVDRNSWYGLKAQAVQAKGKSAKKYKYRKSANPPNGYRFTVAERCDRIAEKKTRNGKPFDKEQCIKNLKYKGKSAMDRKAPNGYRFTVAERCDGLAEKKTRNGKPFDKEQCIKNLTNKRLNKNW